MTTLEELDEISRITFLGPIWVVYSLDLAVVSCLDNIFGCLGVGWCLELLGLNWVWGLIVFLCSFFFFFLLFFTSNIYHY